MPDWDIENASATEVSGTNTALVPSLSAPSQIYVWTRQIIAAIKKEFNRDGPTLPSTGSANAYVLTHGVAIAAYIQGQKYSFVANFSNSGAATLNVDGKGAKAITKRGTTALAGNEILSGEVATVMYDGTQFQLLTSGAGSSIATPVSVANGGTGLAALTAHNLLIGNGTSAATLLAAAAVGTFLGGQGTGSDPAYISAVATIKKQSFTGSGTYTPSTGMLYCLILALGGGGGGGGASSSGQNGAGGGGSGQLAIVLATAATIGASKTITIGGAGTAGSTSGGNGGAGGNTSVGAVAVGNGGNGGIGAASSAAGAGGAGGSGGTSDIATAGTAGGTGAGGAATINIFIGGAGGGTIFGGGGVGSVNAAGGAALGFGGGGGGGSGNASAHAGGLGTAGVVYIIEFCSQ